MQINGESYERIATSLDALNVRIARLAMALDVPLNDAHALARLIDQPQTERPSRRTASSVPRPIAITAEHRALHLFAELRGLLVLRYTLQTRSMADNGLAITQQIMMQTDAHLQRLGFAPGAGGCLVARRPDGHDAQLSHNRSS